MLGGPSFPLRCWLSSQGPHLSLQCTRCGSWTMVPGQEDAERPPSLGNPAPLSPGLATPRHGGPRLPGRGLAPGGPLTQQWLPRGLLCWLLAAGPEVALGVPDLEAGLLPDGAGRGTWGEPKSPQVWPLLWEGRWRGLWRECPSVRGCRGHKATGNWGGGTSSASFFSL